VAPEEIRRKRVAQVKTRHRKDTKIVGGDGSELDLRLSKMGYRHYGNFANDPGGAGTLWRN
jgi:hypothetical protein